MYVVGFGPEVVNLYLFMMKIMLLVSHGLGNDFIHYNVLDYLRVG